MNCPMDYPPGIYIYISIFFSLNDYLYFSATSGIVEFKYVVNGSIFI